MLSIVNKVYKTVLKHSSCSLVKMAKSSFEYVKSFELDDKLLPNAWIVVRIDGKCFHKFADQHSFHKPNDIRALKLMNFAALAVMKDLNDIFMAFGQSDEFSFIFRRNANLYNRRSAKLLTTVNSKFTASYVYHWSKFFGQEMLKYPPTFDGRIIIYPTEVNLIDYMKWRQADVHINNLYNTTFWKLVQDGKLTPAQAEKRLCGTVSADKNEILFQEFNTNYNDEPLIFRRGTLLVWKTIECPGNDKKKCLKIIVDVHDDMLKDQFWKAHQRLLSDKSKETLHYSGPITDIIKEQLLAKHIIPDEMENCDK